MNDKIRMAIRKALGAKKLKLDDVVRDYNGEVTINGLSMADYKGEKVPVFSFVEGDGDYFWGGCQRLRKLAADLQDVCGGLDKADAELKQYGIRIKILPMVRTKAGNNFRPIEHLGLVQLEVGEVIDEETGDVF